MNDIWKLFMFMVYHVMFGLRMHSTLFSQDRHTYLLKLSSFFSFSFYSFLFKKDDFMSICVWPACISVHHTHAVPTEVRLGHLTPGTGVADNFDLTCESWGIKHWVPGKRTTPLYHRAISSVPSHHLFVLKTLKIFFCLSVFHTMQYAFIIQSHSTMERVLEFLIAL